MTSGKAQNAWRRGILCLVAAYCLAHVCVTAVWMLSPWVSEYREWAQADAALQFFGLHGGELYGGPEASTFYVYGILFPFLGYFFTLLSGLDVLLVLRLLSYLSALAAGGVAAWLVFRRSGDKLLALTAFAFLLTADWHNVTGTATPAPLGTLLMLCALAAAERWRVGWSALLTVACFFVKPYFVGIWLPLQAFFFLKSRRQGWWYLLGCAAVGFATAFAVHGLYPNYFVYNVVHHLAAASSVPAHLLRQIALSAVFYGPLFVLFAYGAKRLGRDFFRDAYALSALLLFAMWLRLGLHTGAFMSYVFHFWLPPLVVFALPWLAKLEASRLRTAFLGGIAVLSLWLAAFYLTLPLPPTHAERRQWEQAAAALDVLPRDSALCLSPVLASRAAALSLPSRDNGMVQFYSTLASPSPLVQRLFPETLAFQADAATHDAQLLRRRAGDLFPYVVADERSVLSPDSLRACGYVPLRADTLRVGVHRICVSQYRLQ
ncbi:MAG: hypothetical protein IJ659_09395 [Alloprevotella sp.]|nr:hypothetical protein [Alloprevotella sp.]MBR1594968.1 hypothetical protein [Alloprevotella sp.]